MGQRSLLCENKMSKVNLKATGNQISEEWIGSPIEHFFQENWRIFCGILGKALIFKITDKFLAHKDEAWTLSMLHLVHWTMHTCIDASAHFPQPADNSRSRISPAGRREKFL